MEAIKSDASPNNEAIRQLKLLVNDIEQSGGLIEFSSGPRAPVADPTWTDLGDRIFQVHQFLCKQGQPEMLTIHYEAGED